jgi:hypothetical protein
VGVISYGRRATDSRLFEVFEEAMVEPDLLSTAWC